MFHISGCPVHKYCYLKKDFFYGFFISLVKEDVIKKQQRTPAATDHHLKNCNFKDYKISSEEIFFWTNFEVNLSGLGEMGVKGKFQVNVWEVEWIQTRFGFQFFQFFRITIQTCWSKTVTFKLELFLIIKAIRFG